MLPHKMVPILQLLVAGTAISAQATTYAPVYLVDTALGYKQAVCPVVTWDVDGSSTWDGHKTTAGRKYDHAHPTMEFPLPMHPSLGYSDDEVDATEVDTHFANIHPHHTIEETASTAQNCHGFTTGREGHIGIGNDGIIRIVDDDYEGGPAPEDKFVFQPESGSSNYMEREHSYKITAWSTSTGECGGTVHTPSKVQEKWNTSPIMEIIWTDLVAHYGYKVPWDRMKKK